MAGIHTCKNNLLVGLLLLPLLGLTLMNSRSALAWGSQGHSLATQVAVRALIAKMKHNPKIVLPFQARELMLAHLANIPDTYWRSLPKKKTSLGNPTHYFDLEVISTTPAFSNIPTDFQALLSSVLPACDRANSSKYSNGRICPDGGINKNNILKVVGSAPWRIKQFWQAMKHNFELAKEQQAKLATDSSNADARKAYTLAINQALLNGGLMSHFIADLANPMHNTIDYDGWAKNQGGLHKYFEDLVVNEIDLDLAKDVLDLAMATRPFSKAKELIPKARDVNAITLGLSLSLHSFSSLNHLLELDKAHSMISPSNNKKEGKWSKATRKEPREVQKFYRDFATQQLAVAADAISDFWILAWIKAGRPDLSDFKSYTFYFKPGFVPPDFLPLDFLPQRVPAD